MNNSKSILVIVCGVGIATGYLLNALTSERPPTASSTRNLEITATISHSEVETMRESGFDELDSIEEILRLPSMFARSEATFTLAGRSTGSTVQQLIFEAHEIADPIEREVILNTLFARLTEIDPHAALATARIDPFSVNLSAETSVWRAWARSDLDSAIDAVATEPRSGAQHRIAQTLFRSVGYVGTADADLIEARLGIAPNRATVSQYILSLADVSPRSAIEYINTQVAPVWQAQFASSLGTHLASSGMYNAREFVNDFANPQTKELFEHALASAAAIDDPIATMESIAAGDISFINQQQMYGALSSIVESDLDLALSYYGRIESSQVRRFLGTMIAQQYAARDVDTALQWARENDTRANPELESIVLQAIAQTGPDRAMDEVRDQMNNDVGFGAAVSVLMVLAQSDPQRVFGYLDEHDDSPMQSQMKSMLFSQWMYRSPDEAMSWALGQSSEDARMYLSDPGHLVQQDVNLAIQILPRVPNAVAGNWRRKIAATLVNSRSVDDALAFARSYSDQPGYEAMLSDIAQSAFTTSPEAAFGIAAEIGDTRMRDQTYTRIVRSVSHRDPEQAVSYLSRISDTETRAQVASMTATNWYRQDPRKAVQWIDSYPQGGERDRMMSMIAGQWVDPTPQEQRLLDSVSDPSMRSQIEMNRIITAARTDPDKARRMLSNSQFSDSQRRAIEQSIERSSQHRFSPNYN